MPAGTAPAGAPAQARSPRWAWGPSLAILAPQLCVWAPLLPCLLGTLGSKPHLFRPLFFSLGLCQMRRLEDLISKAIFTKTVSDLCR